MADIFLSYKSDDRARVKRLADALMAEGLSVWWDLHLEGGALWRETIRENLDAAACVIVVWSEASAGPAGQFVQDEASRARRRGVYLPVAIDAIDPPLGFGQEHMLKLEGWRGARRDPRFIDVLAAARAVIEGGPKPIPKARARRISRPGPSPSVLGALAAAGLVLVAGVFVASSPARLCAVARIGCPPPAPAAPANSIAVLPLEDLGGDASQAWFADGLTEELISGLARVGRLQVVGRTSTFRFKDSRETSAVIGQKLGVAYLLDGSVRRIGTHVRVSAALIEASSGFERWSQTYDREMTDIFAVQSGIATAVAEALKVRLADQDIAALGLGGASNPAAFDAYLRGLQLLDQGGAEGAYREALGRFDAAIAADPRFAAAFAARARAYLTLADVYASPDQARVDLDQALASARRAVALAPDLPLAQAALGRALVHRDLDFRGARIALGRAMAAGGGDAQILTSFALFTGGIGDQAPAIGAARRAVQLDPLNPRAFDVLGSVLIWGRRYGEAIGAFRQALALNPQRAGAHADIGDALYLQGRFAEARAEYALEPVALFRDAGEAAVLRRLGDDSGARAAFARLSSAQDAVTAYQQAQVHAQWGQTAEAFQALDEAARRGDTGLLVVKADPLLDPLRGDSRWGALMTRLGLDNID